MSLNTVLVIENDPQVVRLIQDTLEGAGYSVITADNAEEGLSRAKNTIPSLIFLNLATPGANGLEICKTMHSDKSLKDVPLVLLTLREGKFDPIYTKLYGIVMFIKKPFSPADLIACLQEHAPLAATAETGEHIMAVETVTDASEAEQSEDDTFVYSLDESDDDSDDTLDAIGKIFQESEGVEVEGEEVELIADSLDETAQAVEVEDAEDTEDFSIESFEETSSQKAGGSAEFSMESFQDAPAESTVEESGGPQEFDAASFSTSLNYNQETDASDEPSPLLGTSEGTFENAEGLMTGESGGIAEMEMPDVPLAEDLDGEQATGIDEFAMGDLEEASVESLPDKTYRPKRSAGWGRKVVLLVALLVFLGAAGYEGYHYSVHGALRVPGNLTLPEFPELPEVPVLSEYTGKVTKLIDRIKKRLVDSIEQVAVIPDEEKAPQPAKPSRPQARKNQIEKPVPVRPEKKPSVPKASAPARTRSDTQPALFYVQFGAFKSRSNARNFAEKLRGTGLDVFIKETGQDSTLLNLVLLREGFPSYDAAQKEAGEIKSLLGIASAVYKD